MGAVTGFRLADLVMGHARIDDLDVAYIQVPTGDRGRYRSWYLGLGQPGVAAARPFSDGPLVPGRPEATAGQIETHLRLVARMRDGRIDSDALSKACQQAHWHEDARSTREWLGSLGMRDEEAALPEANDVVQDALAPLRSRLGARMEPLREFLALRQRFGSPSGETEPADAIPRILAMADREVAGLLALGDRHIRSTLVRTPAIALDRPRREIELDLMARMGVPGPAARRVAGWPRQLDGLAIQALRAFPLDWIPPAEDKANWAAMDAIVAALRFARVSEPAWRHLAASCKGDWTGFRKRCLRALSRGMDQDDVGHLSLALASSVDVIRGFEHLLWDIRGRDEDAMTDEGPGLLAAQAVVGDRSLPALLENSTLWHARFKAPAPPNVAWEPLLPAWTHEPTGIEVVPIPSSDALVEEGEAMRHCVGGEAYAQGCLSDRIRVVSLRRGEERLSTAEISLRDPDREPGGSGVLQHLARRNLSPPEEAGRALEAYMALPEVWAAREARPNDATLPGQDDEGMAKALEAWRPYLTGKLRHASLEEFREALGAIGPSAAPRP